MAPSGQNFHTALAFTGRNVLVFPTIQIHITYLYPSPWHYSDFLNKYHICRNMRAVLEELHRATMMNPRAVALYSVLCLPGQLLVAMAWDSHPVQIEKPSNHRDQRASWSTKHHGNSFSRLEGCDMEGKPAFTLNLSASVSPRATDESMSFWTLELEQVAGLRGGLTDILVGLPEFCMVHLFDNGFRYYMI